MDIEILPENLLSPYKQLVEAADEAYASSEQRILAEYDEATRKLDDEYRLLIGPSLETLRLRKEDANAALQKANSEAQPALESALTNARELLEARILAQPRPEPLYALDLFQAAEDLALRQAEEATAIARQQHREAKYIANQRHLSFMTALNTCHEGLERELCEKVQQALADLKAAGRLARDSRIAMMQAHLALAN